MITIKCPTCGSEQKFPDEAAGHRQLCRGCGGEVELPSAEGAPPALSGHRPRDEEGSSARQSSVVFFALALLSVAALWGAQHRIMWGVPVPVLAALAGLMWLPRNARRLHRQPAIFPIFAYLGIAGLLVLGTLSAIEFYHWVPQFIEYVKNALK